MRRWLIHALAMLLFAVPLLGAASGQATAATSRVAVIKELKGSATVKKAGGSKEFTAFAKMSLNEGDVLTVGTNGSAVLQFANGSSEDDRMTVSANAKLTFSKLSDKNGTTTKVSLWSGSAWSDVKSIKNKNDEFTLETPTAVMGVRGTHLFTYVDPLSGATRIMVAAGIVSVQPSLNNQNQYEVYPTQNILVTQLGESGGDSNASLAPVDLGEFLSSAGPGIIQAFLNAMADIQEENATLLDAYTDGQRTEQSDLERVQQNILNFVAAIANKAVDEGKVDRTTLQRFVEDANRKLQEQKIDLLKGELTLSEQERAQQEKQSELDKTAKQQAERLKQQEQAQIDRNKALADKLKQEQEKKKKANEELLEQQKKKAFEEYEAKLDQLEQERLRRDKAERDRELSAASPAATGQTGGQPNENPGGEPFVSPLKSLTIKYSKPVSGEVSSSAAPTVEIPVSLATGETTHSIDDIVGNIVLRIERLDEGVLAGGDLKVRANGIPIDVSYGYDNGEDPVIDIVEIPLEREGNVITIDVKPSGVAASHSNVQRITLNLSRPSLPEGISFTTNGVEWTATSPGDFAARTQAVLTSLTVMPTFSTPSYTGAVLDCYMNCEGIEIEGYTISGLAGNKTYTFMIEYDRPDRYPYTVFLNLMNGYPQPDWEQLLEEHFSFIVPYPETPISLELENGAYTAKVGIETERLSLHNGVEYGDGYVYRGLWNERNWYYENWNACGDYSAGTHCLDLDSGDNPYTLYLSDDVGLQTHGYAVNIIRSELPTGVNDWAIKYTADNYETYDSTSLHYRTDDYGCGYDGYYCYYAHIENELGNKASLEMELDGTKLWKYAVIVGDSNEEYVLEDGNGAQSISIDLNEITGMEGGLSPGVHRFALELTDVSERSRTYDMMILIGERQPPLKFYTGLPTNDEYTYLDARYGGDNTWYVYSPDEVQWIDFYAYNDRHTLCYSPFDENENYLECGYADYETGMYRHYTVGEESSFRLLLLDPITGEKYDAYTIVVYNGLPIEPSDYAVTIVDYEGEQVELSELYYEGYYTTFSHSQIPEGMQLVGVYNERGERLNPDGDGVYTFIPEYGITNIYYIVVRDEEYVMPTVLSISLNI